MDVVDVAGGGPVIVVEDGGAGVGGGLTGVGIGVGS